MPHTSCKMRRSEWSRMNEVIDYFFGERERERERERDKQTETDRETENGKVFTAMMMDNFILFIFF